MDKPFPRSISPSTRLSIVLLRESTKLRIQLDEALESECGISLAEKELLTHLLMRDGQMQMSQISDALMFTHGGATKIVGRLVAKQLVDRTKSQEDKRVILVQLKQKGEETVKGAISVMKDLVEQSWREKLSAAELVTLANLLDRLSSA